MSVSRDLRVSSIPPWAVNAHLRRDRSVRMSRPGFRGGCFCWFPSFFIERLARTAERIEPRALPWCMEEENALDRPRAKTIVGLAQRL